MRGGFGAWDTLYDIDSPSAGRAPARRFLLVYSRVGGGHQSAAIALSEGLASVSGGAVRTRLLDAYVDVGRFPASRAPGLYAWLARAHPVFWTAVFHLTNRGSARRDAARPLGLFIGPGLRRAIADFAPDLVVSVLPAVNGALARAAPAGRLEVVLTDWACLHRLWFAPGVQRYHVPTDRARADALRAGAAAEQVAVDGIPVRQAFRLPPDPAAERAETLEGLGLDAARFAVLAMVGAEGSGHALAAIRTLLRLEGGPSGAPQVVVVCGRDEGLRARAQQVPARVPARILGFTSEVPRLMRAADLLVTKAGGVTLAEAFASRVPVVVHDALPGQEARNLAFLASPREGAVREARSPSALAEAVAELAADQPARAALAARGAGLARPDAAETIARGLLERVGWTP